MSHLANAGLHLSWGARHRRYDPGSVTSLATLIAAALAGLSRLRSDPAVSRRALWLGTLGALRSRPRPYR